MRDARENRAKLLFDCAALPLPHRRWNIGRTSSELRVSAAFRRGGKAQLFSARNRAPPVPE